MKKINTPFLKIFGVVLLVLLSSCDFNKVSDAADDFRLIIGLEPIHTTPSVLITDATTGDLISGNVTITFAGQNGADVIDIYSDPISQDKVSDGILNFGIDNSLAPSESSPVKIQLILEANGYQQKSRTIIITEEGSPDFYVKMLKENSGPYPDGIQKTTNTQGSAGNDGAIQENFVVESPSNQNGNGTSLEVPEGSVFLGANGSPLRGSLRTELTYYNPSADKVFELLPFELTDNDGNPIQAAGVNTIRIMDENGNLATSLEAMSKQKAASAGEISVSFSLPDGFKKPDGSSVKIGDEIFIFTFSHSFQLTEVVSETVEVLANGKTGVVFNTTTLPYAVVTGYALTELSASCPAQLTIERNGNSGALIGSAYSTGFFIEVQIGSSNNEFTFIAPNAEVNIDIQTATTTHSVTANFCTQPNVTVNLPTPPPNIIDSSVNITLGCAAPDEKISITDLPAASVAYRKSSAAVGTPWRLAENLEWEYDEDEQALTGVGFDITGVEQDEEYTFKVSFDGNTYQQDVAITSSSVAYEETINEDICQ